MIINKGSVGIMMLVCLALIVCAQKSDGDLTAKAQAQVESMANGDFDSVFKNFDKTMQSVMPPDKLKEVWGALIGQVGSFNKQVNTRTEQIVQYNAVYVTCEFERAKIDIKVVFDKSGRIAGLFFLPT